LYEDGGVSSAAYHGLVPAVLRWGVPLNVDDLAGMPDDGHRYELIDGTLIVTPAPSAAHQRAVTRLAVMLSEVVGEHLEVLVAPFEWMIDDNTAVQPDVLVFRRAEVDPDRLRVPPLLAVEVISPSTRSIDLGAKLDAYGRGGLGHYWVVDPIEPSLAVFALDGGVLVPVASVAGDDAYDASSPFAVRVVPPALAAVRR
jgi:Uma2 family endonuclease